MEQAKFRPESEKIALERSMQKDASGVGLKGYERYIEPEIVTLLEGKNVPNAPRVAKEIMKGLSEFDADMYGSLIQAATRRMIVEKKLPYERPPITREIRDLDVHMRTPTIGSYKLTDMINRAAGDKVVEVGADGNPQFTKLYDKQQSKLFDLHDKDISPEGMTGEGEYIGFGMRQPARTTMIRKPLIMKGGSMKAITLSEQAIRKQKGASIFRIKPETMTTEEGLSTTGRVIPEKAGRIKDISDAYNIRLFQSDVLRAKGQAVKAARVEAQANRWIDLYGEGIAKNARKQARENRLSFTENVGYSTKSKSLSVPTTKVVSSPAQPSQQQKTSMRFTDVSKLYNFGVSKSPYKPISASRSTIASRLTSRYTPSASKSAVSPSISSISYISSPSLISPPSPSPSLGSPSSIYSPSPSPSPISPSPSPYSPSPRSPPYRYSYPTLEIPPGMWGIGSPNFGGGGDEKRRVRVKRFKIKQPIRTGAEVLSGINMPVISYNLAGGRSARSNTEQNISNLLGTKKKRKIR
jgi:hypothetical protein